MEGIALTKPEKWTKKKVFLQKHIALAILKAAETSEESAVRMTMHPDSVLEAEMEVCLKDSKVEIPQ